MAGRLSALVAVLAILAAAGCAHGQLVSTEDRVLVLTSVAAGTATDFIQDALLTVGQRFTVVAFDPTNRVNISSTVWNADGTGKYRAFFMYPDLDSTTFTASEAEELWAYQRATGARSAKWGVWPTAAGYMPHANCSIGADVMGLTPDAPLGTSGVPASKALSGSGLGGCAGDTTQPQAVCAIWSAQSWNVQPTCDSKPIVVATGSVPLGVTGSLIKYNGTNDTRESMAFTFECAAWSETCRLLARVAVNWMVSGGATAIPPPAQPNIVVQHSVLVLTTPGFTSNDFLIKVMDGYGVPYTVFAFNKDAVPKTNLTTLLLGASGNAPQFSAIVLYPNLEALGSFDRAQLDALWSYQRRTGARTLKFATWLTAAGFETVNEAACSNATISAKLTPDAPLGISGINPDVEIALTGVYRCPATPLGAVTDSVCPVWGPGYEGGLWPGCKPTPILQVDTGVLGALVKYADGRESMVFQFDCAAWSTECTVLAHLAVTWLVQNIIPGERRPLLTIEADDFFLATEQGAGVPDYRVSRNDLLRQVQWQEGELLGFTVPGTNIKIDLPFNGNGVLERVQAANGTLVPLDVDDRGCIDFPEYVTFACNCWWTPYKNCTHPVQFCRQCTKDWPKPLGTGTNRVPAKISTSWPVAQLMRDELAQAIYNNINGITSKFFFSSHTFTHENLDNATKYDTQQQMQLNTRMANSLLLSTKPTFSSRCLVSPQISGLVNGDVLSALNGLKFACATGDNTWNHLLNKAKPHSYLVTTKAINGYAGYHIVPRWATEVYYNCSTVEQNEALYNSLYSYYWGGPSSIDDIMKRDAIRVVRDGVLALRKDPHMMHQANLRVDSTGYSLAMRWVRAVVTELKRYVLWPVESLKLDDVYTLFRARTARDNCRPSYTLEVGQGAVITAIRATAATGSCTVPLLYGDGGSNALTASVSVTAGTVTTFPVSGLKWTVGPK